MTPDEVEMTYRAALSLLHNVLHEGHVSKTVLMCALDADLLPPAWMEEIPLLPPETPTPAPPCPLDDLPLLIV